MQDTEIDHGSCTRQQNFSSGLEYQQRHAHRTWRACEDKDHARYKMLSRELYTAAKLLEQTRGQLKHV